MTGPQNSATQDDDLENSSKDQNVYAFMMQLVQEKHGDEVESDFLSDESDKLYEMFGEVLLRYFEPQLNEEQKKQFDQLIESKENQDALMNFLLESISDLESQIVNVLISFRNDYLLGRLEKDIVS